MKTVVTSAYRYTFGQPVQGDVEGSVCLKDSRREYVFNETTRRYDPKPMVPDVCVQIDQPVSIHESETLLCFLQLVLLSLPSRVFKLIDDVMGGLCIVTRMWLYCSWRMDAVL